VGGHDIIDYGPSLRKVALGRRGGEGWPHEDPNIHQLIIILKESHVGTRGFVFVDCEGWGSDTDWGDKGGRIGRTGVREGEGVFMDGGGGSSYFH